MCQQMKEVTEALAVNQETEHEPLVNWLVIGHAVSDDGFPCPDAFAGVWVIDKYLKNNDVAYHVKFIKTQVKEVDFDVSQYDCIILIDVIVDQELLNYWLSLGKMIMAIDHHKSSKDIMQNALNVVKGDALKAFFDSNECAASLAWKILFPADPMPAFLTYVKDRDNWDELLPNHQEVHAALNKLRRSFSLFDTLEHMNSEELLKFLVPVGFENAEKRRKTVERLCRKHWIGNHFGHDVPMLLLTKSYNYLASDVGSYLCKKYPDAPFAAIHRPSDQKWSYRSNKYGSNFDVEVLVSQYGGGGHLNAGSWHYVKADEYEGYKRYIAPNGLFILSTH